MIIAMYFSKYIFNCPYSFQTLFNLISRKFSELSISKQFIKSEENFISVLLDLPENHGKILCLPNFMSLKCSYPYGLMSVQYRHVLLILSHVIMMSQIL